MRSCSARLCWLIELVFACLRVGPFGIRAARVVLDRQDYTSAFSCLHPGSAVKRNSGISLAGLLKRGILPTDLELVLLSQSRDPGMSRQMIFEMVSTHENTGRTEREATVDFETFDSFMTGSHTLNDKAIQVLWTDVITEACFNLNKEDLNEWHVLFNELDRDGDGWVSEEDFDNLGVTRSHQSLLFASLLFHTKYAFLEKKGLGFYQFVRGTTEKLMEMAWRTAAIKKGDTKIEKDHFLGVVQSWSEGGHPVTDKMLKLIWNDLDEAKTGFVTRGSFESKFLKYFYTNSVGRILVRPQVDIVDRHRKILLYRKRCLEDVTTWCIEQTCPKYCSLSASSSQKAECLASCTEEGRCRHWQTGTPAFAEGDEVVEAQTFAQAVACVTARRLTSGVTGGNWKAVTSPWYRDILSRRTATDLRQTKYVDQTVYWQAVANGSEDFPRIFSFNDFESIVFVGRASLETVLSDWSIDMSDENIIKTAHEAWVHQYVARWEPSWVKHLPRYEDLTEEERRAYLKVANYCFKMLSE